MTENLLINGLLLIFIPDTDYKEFRLTHLSSKIKKTGR